MFIGPDVFGLVCFLWIAYSSSQSIYASEKPNTIDLSNYTAEALLDTGISRTPPDPWTDERGGIGFEASTYRAPYMKKFNVYAFVFGAMHPTFEKWVRFNPSSVIHSGVSSLNNFLLFYQALDHRSSWNQRYQQVPYRFQTIAVSMDIYQVDATTAKETLMGAMWVWLQMITRFLLTEFIDEDWIPTFDMVLSWSPDPKDKIGGRITSLSSHNDL